MLPVIAATHGLIPKGLARSVSGAIREPVRGNHTRSGTAPPPHHYALEPKERTVIIRVILG